MEGIRVERESRYRGPIVVSCAAIRDLADALAPLGPPVLSAECRDGLRRRFTSLDEPWRRAVRALALAIALAVSAPAPAQQTLVTGSELVDWCGGAAPSDRRAGPVAHDACRTYLAGVYDATRMWAGVGYLSHRLCIPLDVGADRLRAMLLRFVRVRPGLARQVPASSLVLFTFLDEWECGLDEGPRR